MKLTRLLAACVLAALSASAGSSQESPPPPTLEVLWSPEVDADAFHFEPGGSKLALGSSKGVRVVDLPFGGPEKFIPWDEPVSEVAWDPSMKLLVVRTTSNRTELLDWPSGRTLRYHAEPPAGAARGPQPPGRGPAVFTASGAWVALANAGKGFRIWTLDSVGAANVSRQAEVPEQNVEGWGQALMNHVTALRFGGGWVFAGQEDGYLSVYDYKKLDPVVSDSQRKRGLEYRPTRTLESAQAFRPHAGDITSIGATRDGGHLFTAGTDGHVRMWSVTERVTTPPWAQPVRPKDPPRHAEVPGRFLAYQPLASVLAVSEPAGVRIYRVTLGATPGLKATHFLPADPKIGRPARLAFDTAGRHLAVLYCKCVDCDRATSPMRDRARRPYEHGGRIVVYDARPLKGK